MPKRNDEELKKVAQMVKEKNYNHKELGILKHEDIVRMKVSTFLFRKSSANPPRKKKNLKKEWLRKKSSKN